MDVKVAGNPCPASPEIRCYQGDSNTNPHRPPPKMAASLSAKIQYTGPPDAWGRFPQGSGAWSRNGWQPTERGIMRTGKRARRSTMVLRTNAADAGLVIVGLVVLILSGCGGTGVN